MKKSDIYEIAIKILGIYLFLKIIQLFVVSIGVFWELISEGQPLSDIIIYGGSILLAYIIMILLDLGLIFKTDVVARKLCRISDFEQEVQFTASRKVIYEIALVLMGMITIVWALPDFIYKVWTYFQTLQTGIADKKTLVTSGIKIVIGLIAVVYSTAIANFLVKEKAVD